MTNEKFKAIRLYLKLSQPQFADFLGVSNSSVSMIEGKHRAVSARMEAAIHQKFDVTSPDFISFFTKMSKRV